MLDKKTKIGLLALITIFVISVSAFITPAGASYPSYDRTDNIGILIPAKVMDGNNITPALCYAMIQNIANSKNVEFASVKITYGYDQNYDTYTYISQRIDIWVDYFDDYFDNIYVASRTVFHSGEKLSPYEIAQYYYTLANYLNDYDSVKGFFGEEEPEAKQLNPYTGDPEGNNLAYDDMQDMMDYIEDLYDCWHTVSDIPFGFASIPLAEYRWKNGEWWIYGDAGTWFDSEGYTKDGYWGWIFENSDFFSIDEWRTHYGTQEWANIVRWYNENNEPDRKMIIGETFNFDSAETQELLDQFNYQSVNDLGCAFWWLLCGSEYAWSENPSDPNTYIYFGGGYKGHLWANTYFQTVSANNICGDGVASAMTYSDSSSDQAYASLPISVTTNVYNYEFYTRFNIDMAKFGTNSSDIETILGYWAGSSGRYYAITAKLTDYETIALKFYYPNLYGSMTSETFADRIKINCWNWASIRLNGAYVILKYGYEDATGLYGTYNLATKIAYPYSTNINAMIFGAMGGALTKLYIGEIGIWDWNTNSAVVKDDFEDWFYRSSTWHLWSINYMWSSYFDEPSAVQCSSRIIPSNGAQWLIARLKYSVDY